MNQMKKEGYTPNDAAIGMELSTNVLSLSISIFLRKKYKGRMESMIYKALEIAGADMK